MKTTIYGMQMTVDQTIGVPTINGKLGFTYQNSNGNWVHDGSNWVPWNAEGPSVVSGDSGNIAILGSDSYIYVPKGGDMLKNIYDTTDSGIIDNSELVNNLTVETSVPLNAVFTDTDTIYNDTSIQNKIDDHILNLGVHLTILQHEALQANASLSGDNKVVDQLSFNNSNIYLGNLINDHILDDNIHVIKTQSQALNLSNAPGLLNAYATMNDIPLEGIHEDDDINFTGNITFVKGISVQGSILSYTDLTVKGNLTTGTSSSGNSVLGFNYLHSSKPSAFLYLDNLTSKFNIDNGIDGPKIIATIDDITSIDMMLKSIYDTTDSGIVDDSEKLGGLLSSEYATNNNLNDHINNTIPHVSTDQSGALNSASNLSIANRVVDMDYHTQANLVLSNTINDHISNNIDAHGIDLKENSLGDPNLDGYVLSSLKNGTRMWVVNPTGDMQKFVYDSNDNGIVDNSSQLGGEDPSFYTTQNDFLSHKNSLDLHTTTFQNNALDGANAPSSLNVFATMNDLGTGGVDKLVELSDTPGNYGLAGQVLTSNVSADGTLWTDSIQGPQGEKGDNGLDSIVPGPKGDQGVTGPQGAQGVQGPIGLPGTDGTDGTGVSVKDSLTYAEIIVIDGAAGDMYIVTDTGGIDPDDYTSGDGFVSNGLGTGASNWNNVGPIKGPTGDTGIQGIQGPTGPGGIDGVDGAQGFTGPKGDPGPIGATGAPGLEGPKGNKGDTGDTGPKGDDGADSTVPGPKGDTGSIGPDGPAGPKGDTGADSTVPGPQGIKGDDSTVPGPQGIKGDDGATGSDGADGAGIAVGGVAGQILSKIDGTDFNTEWVDKSATGSFFPIDASEKMTGALRIEGVGESKVVLLNNLGQEQGQFVINKSTGQVSIERLNPANGEIESKLMLGSKAVSMAGLLGGAPEILNDQDLTTKKYVDGANTLLDDRLVVVENSAAGAIIKINEGYAPADAQRVLDPTGWAPIGENSLDLSVGDDKMIDKGAAREFSFIQGYNNKGNGYATMTNGWDNVSSGNYSMVTGISNTTSGGGIIMTGVGLDSTGGDMMMVLGKCNTLPTGNPYFFQIGNGEVIQYSDYDALQPGDRIYERGVASDAFRVYKTGMVEAPSLTVAMIDSFPSNEVMVTKEWAEKSLGNPDVSGQVLSSAANGVRTWVDMVIDSGPIVVANEAALLALKPVMKVSEWYSITLTSDGESDVVIQIKFASPDGNFFYERITNDMIVELYKVE